MIQCAVAVGAAAWFAGCASTAGCFTDETQPIEVFCGQRFELALASNPTTGYSWALAKRLEPRVVTLAENRYCANDAAAAGAGGVEVWTFVARHEGTASIALAYRRPWEKGQAPAAARVFRVHVRKR